MNVGMEVKFAGPGVKYSGNAECSTEILFVATEFLQGFGSTTKEHVENEFAIAHGKRTQLGRQSKDQMKVSCRQNTFLAANDPLGLV
jgi:hypothetical protein